MNIVKAKKVEVEIYSHEIVQTAIEKVQQAERFIQDSITIKKNRDLLIKAVDLYHESINIYPKLSSQYIGLAYISFVTNEIENSIALIQNALDIDSTNKKAREMLLYYQEQLNKKSLQKQSNKNIEAKNTTSISSKLSEEFKKQSVKGRLDFSGTKVTATKRFISSINNQNNY